MEGYIQNELKTPMRNATIKIEGVGLEHNVSPNLAFYKIMLPPGHYKVTVKCHGYEDQEFEAVIVDDNLSNYDIQLSSSRSFTVNKNKNIPDESSTNNTSKFRKVSGFLSFLKIYFWFI